MADSTHRITAILTAKDQMTGVMKGAMSKLSALGSKVKNGVGFGVMMAAGQAAFNGITSSVGGLISEVNESNKTWKSFEGNMAMLGKSDAAPKLKSSFQKYAQATIYSSSDMAQTYTQLASVGAKSADKLVTGFAGLAASAESPKQAMKTLSQQAVQMAGRPTVAWQDFKLMLEQSPAGMAQVAKAMGKTTQQLVSDIQAGTVSTEEFFAAVNAVGNSNAFQKMATQYKGVDEAMDGLKETAANVLGPSFEVLSQVAINAIQGIITKLESIDGAALAEKVSGFIDKAKPYWEGFKTVVSGVWTVLKGAGSVVATVAGALSSLNDKLGGALIPSLFAVAAGFAAVLIVKKLTSPISMVTNTVGKSSGPSLKAAAAYLALGAAVLMAGTGFALIVQSAINLANAGGVAIAVAAGMVVAIVALAVGAALLGPLLTAGAVGMLAFGAAILMVGAGVLLAAAGMTLLSSSLPMIAAYGQMAAVAILALSVSLVAIGVSGAVAGAAMIVLAAGTILAAAGMIAFGAAVLVAGAGMLVASAGALVLAGAIPAIAVSSMLAATSMMMLAAALLLIAAGGAVAGAALLVLTAGAIAAAAILAVLGAAALVGSAGMAVFGASMTVAAGGTVLLAGSLKLVVTQLKQASSQASKTASQLQMMVTAVSIVQAGLSTLSGIAKNAMAQIASAFNDAAGKALTSGRQLGTNFTNGMKSTLSKAPSIARQYVNSATSAMSGGYSRAYSAGQNIGRGFANGMSSMLGTIRSIAAQMAAAANAAIAAKAKIGSPSKVTDQFGRWYGQGFVNGIKSMTGKAWDAAEKMINIPKANGLELCGEFASAFGSGALGVEFEFERNNLYTIEVPVYIDGREVAKATAPYTEEELNKRNVRDNRKKGRI